MRPIYDLGGAFADQILTAEAEAGRVYEAVIGIVTDNKDPDKLARVKVKIPILSQETTWWTPVVMLGAGKNRGWFFIPEKDDEVLILFEHGDVNRPVIIGSLYNGKDKPPDKNPGGNPRRMIKSRGGSKITFDDENGKLIIEDGGGKGKITFESQGNKLTIDASSADVCVQSPADQMKMVAKSAKFEATGNLEIHAGSTIKAEGKDVTIKGADARLSGSTTDFNSGKATAAEKASTSPVDCPDPYGS